MTTKVFKSYIEFSHREDKKVNGVSESFAADHPKFEKDNATNKGCWNCKLCYNCTGCTDCLLCHGCTDCTYCSRCSQCTDCTDCDRCNLCYRCNDCNMCNFCNDLKNKD